MYAPILIVLGVFCLFATVAHSEPPVPVNEDRLAEITSLLKDGTFALGEPVRNRESWARLAEHPKYKDMIPDAEVLLGQPPPEMTEALFMEYFENGVRVNWQHVDGKRRNRLAVLFLAECLEGEGRFIPAVEEMLLLLCDEPTWMMPAHPPALESYRGEAMGIDLKAADVGHTLAVIHALAGDRLSPETRDRVRHEVGRRILAPFRGMVTGERPAAWWLTGTNNWNSVCIAGLTGAALALVEDKAERAFYVAAAEAYTRFFLEGFTPDGYCSEGVSYWGYGYGHYLLLCELVHRATEGRMDLLQRDGALAPARYAGIAEIQHGIYPPFADCSINATPSPEYMRYVSRRLGLGFNEWEHVDTAKPSSSIPLAMMFSFPNSADDCPPSESETPRLGPRTWFPDAGVLICRPGDAETRMAVAMKGGHNAEHHNHNDVGSFLVVLGSETVLADPGSEVYTQRTFSLRRYESDVLNSFGHSVPRVAGQLQQPGPDARGEVLSTAFSDDRDTLELDLVSAYDVPELKELRRRFEYAREGAGSLTVTDSVAFDSPQTFEAALVTFGTWAEAGEDTLVFRLGEEAVRVHIDTGGLPFDTDATVIEEDLGANPKPTRVAIRLTEPVESAVITVAITPNPEE
jgi:hypothetical protein